MLKSFLSELTIYSHSRLITWRIAVLIVAIAVLSLVIAKESPISTLWIATLLITQFRLWDDIHDIPHDRIHAPGRVLVTSTFISSYYVVLVVIFIITVASVGIWRSTPQLERYVFFCCAIEAVYRISNWKGQWRLIRNHLVLLKYPVFLLLCSASVDIKKTITLGLLIYLALSVEELAMDRSLEPIKIVRMVLFLEAILFIIVIFTRVI